MKRPVLRNTINLTVGVALAALVSVPTAFAAEIADLYDQIKASVVVIKTESREVSPVAPGQLMSVGGLGSGVLISDDGKVMTAAHVVQTADSVTVTFLSGESVSARVLSSEPAADVALIQLDRMPEEAKVASIGDSDRVRVGEQIFVVGAPFGIEHSLTVGHISARRIEENAFGMFASAELFQTDAAINTGNSGGPMFNQNGEVIGIVSYIISQTGAFEGLGFVITSNTAQELLLSGPSLWSGFQGQMLTGELARALNIPQQRAMLIERVAQRSLGTHLGVRGGTLPVDIAGTPVVLGGDVLLAVLGVSLEDPDARQKVRDKATALKSGDEIVVTVLRGGKVVELKNFFFPDVLIPKAPTR